MQAELYGQRAAQAVRRESAAALKGAYLKRYGIPARMFNGVRVSLDGKWHRSRSNSAGDSAAADCQRRAEMRLRVAEGVTSEVASVGQIGCS